MSYSWKEKATVKQISEYLIDSGIRIWSDDKEINGNIYNAMADGIERSKIVILCISKAYDESVNCCRERDWAADLNKPIIPLIMEQYDMSRSRSRFVSAGLLYYKFFDQTNQPIEGTIFETEMRRVLHAINTLIKASKYAATKFPPWYMLFFLVTSRCASFYRSFGNSSTFLPSVTL